VRMCKNDVRILDVRMCGWRRGKIKYADSQTGKSVELYFKQV
jgi:hypothetical protein